MVPPTGSTSVQYYCERRESLLHWLSDNCEDFREMKGVRYAKYVKTMIGQDGHVHRWNGTPEKIIQRALKINASTKKPG